ncbi:regulator of G-protein signaling 12-like isoform X1 [Acipenser ruthenus]|uniref:regulator of G-protein signaling 12-like isoform X1 n=1 Tax=Acipenser ruthenus TaxID=7906 RepID=UPI00155F65CE|nr:regulator of G-protein signaling 12-like isoform X1 [Acipenser ruthenus]XP_033891582.2 regulator of G-protein signaling 12-like isoform X1 [Acipenser ruthenus]
MFRPGETVKRRLNVHTAARVRSVEVARGRAGYGFTLSGQAPCLLNCILKGSPADYVGLRAGDHVLSVNEINVSKASQEDVVKLIGKCTGVLHMVIAESSNHIDSCSSDEELGFHETKNWVKPKIDSKTLGINRAERVVAEMQSGGIFNMIFENSSHSSSSSGKSATKPRPLSEPDFNCRNRHESVRSNPDLLSEEEMAKVLNDDSVFADMFENQDDFGLDASILNVGMIVGYLGSIELASTSANLENDSLQAIRGCMRRLRAEQKIHSLVMMKIMHDCIQLCNDKGAVIAVYPAEKLAFSAVCPDDRRFFGLVTMQVTDDQSLAKEEESGLRTSCHVFMVDAELCHHKIHQGIARRFRFECTPDPDINGCLEFPPTSQPVLQFVSVLYRDMGESIEGMRARAFLDGDNDAQQNNSTSSNSDSGIGNFQQEEKNNRVLLVDLGSNPSRHVPNSLWENPQARNPNQAVSSHWNGYRYDQDGAKYNLSELSHPGASHNPGGRHLGPSARLEVPVTSSRPNYPQVKKAGTMGAVQSGSQRWLPVHVLQDWQQGHSSDQESYAESTDGWSSANCSTLPPPMSKIPADRYRVAGEIVQPSKLITQKDEWAKKLFGAEKTLGAQQNGKRNKEDGEKKSSRFRGISVGFSQRSSGRRSYGRSKRFSLARSLDDLESAAASDGEIHGVDRKGCGSEISLNSNASLPSVQSCRRHTERRVPSWAVSFERLLQDPVGVRYFSEFLKKEFSEENILFWQACEIFSHVPEKDKKQLSQRAREIYNSFLSSKATTPVNIDSQAQLADDILNAPRPDMFKVQQLQIFNLMKFDSYTRFLKSPLYQECMLAEVEGRPLPDPYQVPSSPASKHSINSDRSNLSTPKKSSKKSKSGRSLNEDNGEDHADNKKKGTFFSWTRNKSFGKGTKKRENGFLNDCSESNSRHESQDSLSSGASLELLTSNSISKNECDVSRVPLLVPEKEKSLKHCYINLPDGSTCALPLRPGVSIRELLLGLCAKLCFNLAAVDLFLVGGEKPLVLDQDCMTLSSRDLRLEKRTLFRLDLVPINRSVGLKAKPTKPVTEVLRPVVAKYGLHLSNLVAKISGEKEPLDLGVPISSLDGLRVVLDVADQSTVKDKQQSSSVMQSHAPPLSKRSYSTGDEKTPGKSFSVKARGESGKATREVRPLRKEESVDKLDKRKQKKINIDEAEEFFELLSKAQNKRANDQRGLLKKEDLVLPDFLRLIPEPTSSTPSSHQPGYRRGKENAGKDMAGSSLNTSRNSRGLDSTLNYSEDCSNTKTPSSSQCRSASMPPNNQKSERKEHAPFAAALSPIPHVQDTRQPETIQTVDDENVADLTLVGEGDITSPNSTLLPQSPTAPFHASNRSEASFSSPALCANSEEPYVFIRSSSENRQREIMKTPVNIHSGSTIMSSARKGNLPVNRTIDVDAVKLEDTSLKPSTDPDLNLSFEGYVSELRSCQGRMRTGVYKTSDLPSLFSVKNDKSKASETKYTATFV